MQPLTTLAQAASEQLGTLHPYEGNRELEVLVLGEQNSAEARGRERSDDLSGHHHEEMKAKTTASDQLEPHRPYARYGEQCRIRRQRIARMHSDTPKRAEGVDTGGTSPLSSPRCLP